MTLAKFIDSFVSCSTKIESCSNIVKEVQIHHHSKSCKKFGSECRFGFPKLPSEKTIIAQPFELVDEGEDIDDNHDTEKKKEEIVSKYKNIVKTVKAALLELDPDTKMTIPEFLSELEIGEEDYYRAISVSVNGVSIVLKRDLDEIFVNPYNPEWINAWNGNMDFQCCLDYFQIISYITDYYMKSEGQLIDILMEAAKEVKKKNLSEQMKTLTHAFLQHRQVSLSEAVYSLIPNLHLKDSNIKSQYIATGFPNQRSKFLEHVVDAKQNDVSLISIKGREGKYKVRKSIHEKYAKRPAILEELCLAQFQMMYESKSIKTCKAVEWKDNCHGTSNTEMITWKGKQGYLPQKIKLLEDFGIMHIRKDPCVIRIHKINKSNNIHEFIYSELLLFHPWMTEEELHESDFNRCLEMYETPSNDESLTRIEVVKSLLLPHLNSVQEGRAKVDATAIKRNLHIGDILDPQLEQENDDDMEEEMQLYEDYQILAGNLTNSYFHLDFKSRICRCSSLKHF